MMEKITLKNCASDGTPLQVTYLPGMGMNMVSFKKGEIEAIDQGTWPLFEERFAGLGALIGPHFHHRYLPIIPKIKDESLFPHIARIRANGTKEPFSHGIARYAPWQAEATTTSIKAVLTGKDTWQGIPLAELEGQNFKMSFQADLQPDGLHIDMSVVSDTDSLVGIHYYYHLPEGKGKVSSVVQNTFLDRGKLKKIPADWEFDDQHNLIFPMERSADYTFHPYPNPCRATIHLVTDAYRLITTYTSDSQENAWQLYHPKGASYVCIEPVSAQDPRHPNLTVSSIKICLNIEKE